MKGSVPGSKNSIVLIQQTSKNIKRLSTLEKLKKVEDAASKNIVQKKASSKSSKSPEKESGKDKPKLEVKTQEKKDVGKK